MAVPTHRWRLWLLCLLLAAAWLGAAGNAPPACPAGCGQGDSKGVCVNGTCQCSPGYGSTLCTFSVNTLHGPGDIYHGFAVENMDTQGWTHTADKYEAIASEADAQTIVEVRRWVA